MSASFRGGHCNRARDVLEVQLLERRIAVKEHVRQQQNLLAVTKPLRPRRHFPEVDAFLSTFETPQWRRPILAIIGNTGTGKSRLAKCVLGELATKLGVPEFLEVTVEDDDHIDMSDFDVRHHSGVLLDGVGDATFLLKHRELLQGRDKEVKGAKSATVRYAYQTMNDFLCHF